jgi:hypothetical protein
MEGHARTRRAIRDALPFLHRAKRVTVIEICESDQQQAARAEVDDVALDLA